uniref:Uncharacterized protein n=1 Tax=Romanomermis culicivorax TaxID=13658 RepID=A0A915JEN4_ROMCU
MLRQSITLNLEDPTFEKEEEDDDDLSMEKSIYLNEFRVVEAFPAKESGEHSCLHLGKFFV